MADKAKAAEVKKGHIRIRMSRHKLVTRSIILIKALFLPHVGIELVGGVAGRISVVTLYLN